MSSASLHFFRHLPFPGQDKTVDHDHNLFPKRETFSNEFDLVQVTSKHKRARPSREAPPKENPWKFGHCRKGGRGQKACPNGFVAVLQ